MERAQVTELHYLTAIENVSSILANGILSHNRAAAIAHKDLSMAIIQEKRDKKRVPGGLPLHDYVNLYFNGRNKMMAKKRPEHSEMCVLRVSSEVLDLKEAVIADQNAASFHVAFFRSPSGLIKLDYDEVFIRSWKCQGDQIREWRLGSKVCAELLIPHWLDAKYVLGAYVLDEAALSRFTQLGTTLSCAVNRDLFLR